MNYTKRLRHAEQRLRPSRGGAKTAVSQLPVVHDTFPSISTAEVSTLEVMGTDGSARAQSAEGHLAVRYRGTANLTNRRPGRNVGPIVGYVTTATNISDASATDRETSFGRMHSRA